MPPRRIDRQIGEAAYDCTQLDGDEIEAPGSRADVRGYRPQSSGNAENSVNILFDVLNGKILINIPLGRKGVNFSGDVLERLSIDVMDFRYKKPDFSKRRRNLFSKRSIFSAVIFSGFLRYLQLISIWYTMPVIKNSGDI